MENLHTFDVKIKLNEISLFHRQIATVVFNSVNCPEKRLPSAPPPLPPSLYLLLHGDNLLCVLLETIRM